MEAHSDRTIGPNAIYVAAPANRLVKRVQRAKAQAGLS